MKPAPPLDCEACGRTIGKRAGHNATADLRIICTKCLWKRHLHSEWFPDCPERWHDMQDHAKYVAGTRAGLAAALGLWP